MAGIVTTSSAMGSLGIYRMVFSSTSTSLAINWVSGTTSAASGPLDHTDKGVEVTFQNQSTAAVNVWIGGANLIPAIGTTSTLGPGGVFLAQNGTFSVGHRHAPSAIQMGDWYAATTSTIGICTAVLVKAV